MDLEKARNDLAFLGEFEVVLFGSEVEGGARPSSDVDVAVVTRRRDREFNLSLLKSSVGRAPPEYDIHVFELLPLAVQMSVANDYAPVFGDDLDLSEYFYYYRKLWQDCRHRILDDLTTSYRDRLVARQRWLEAKRGG
ncbi:MAG: nucleotidyltransferase domain-containing protein [Promethearchaeota archaeon]